LLPLKTLKLFQAGWILIGCPCFIVHQLEKKKPFWKWFQRYRCSVLLSL